MYLLTEWDGWTDKFIAQSHDVRNNSNNSDSKLGKFEVEKNNRLSYLLKIVSNKHEIHTAETQLWDTQEKVHKVSDDERETMLKSRLGGEQVVTFHCVGLDEKTWLHSILAGVKSMRINKNVATAFFNWRPNEINYNGPKSEKRKKLLGFQ